MSSATLARSQNVARPQNTGRIQRPPTSAGKTPPTALGKTKPEPQVLFQTYFKSVGPRTYAAQVKQASNENQFLVLTEGKRDEKTGEVRKTRLFIFSEDFEAYFSMVQEAAQFIKAHPVSPKVRARQAKFWAGKNQKQPPSPADTTPAPEKISPPPRPGNPPATRRPAVA